MSFCIRVAEFMNNLDRRALAPNAGLTATWRYSSDKSPCREIGLDSSEAGFPLSCTGESILYRNVTLQWDARRAVQWLL